MPTVSVIMGVRNAGESVRDSVAGILTQSFSDTEFIVVNDGSSDDTGKILDELATTDGRLRILHQENQGLTRSLISASEMASGDYIARQDADDVSAPDRLEKQLAALQHDNSAVLATCWVEDMTPEGVVCGRHQNLQHAVKLESGEDLQMTGVPAHGSVLIRRSAFDHVGGYRSAFYYAQDSDLWLRLADTGRFVVVPEFLYRRTLGINCISSRFRSHQTQFCELAQECFRAAKQGTSDQESLRAAERLAEECRRRKDDTTSRRDRATSLMLLGAALTEQHPKLAHDYFKRAVGTDLLHWRAWKGLLLHNLRQIFARRT